MFKLLKAGGVLALAVLGFLKLWGAKVTMPLMSATASGKLGTEIVFDKRGRVRKYVIPANPRTVDQVAWRNQLKDIQAVMFLMGSLLRGELKTKFGAYWNSDIVGDLTSNNASALTAYVAEYNAFIAGDKTAWQNADTATKVVIADGAALYAVASAVYDRSVRLGETITLTQPATGNAATVGVEWLASV